MKTLSNDLLFEKYFTGKLSTAQRLVFQARVLCEPQLAQEFELHKKVRNIVRLHHQALVKKQLMDVYDQLFADPSSTFKQRILSLFKS
jgi:hypothetical protein